VGRRFQRGEIISLFGRGPKDKGAMAFIPQIIRWEIVEEGNEC
jgi:hypothetical protein